MDMRARSVVACGGRSPDTTTKFGHWQALARGSAVGAGHVAGQSALWLDNQYFPDEGNTESSDEYGRTAVKNGTTTDGDGNDVTVWQDRPVLRTDQSFTVSAWVMLQDGLIGNADHTVIAQRGTHESAFWLKYYTTWTVAVAVGHSGG
ncbi:hypothetical protein GCM10010172_44070 [Paractinoplanes ferrugineus]|uniref:Uncharacterized protein n=1 Tax=Paractinoplanes ferrugineus TaxID=113564 RepID=A0A919J431_9ACTN|nr:hypothetical protein Afe05nite_54050 [Actinoplanes ferrugineus]